MHRQPTQPETAALTTIATSLATLAWTWTPGLITPAVLAVLTYLAVITGAAKALRWDVPHALHASSVILRQHLAAVIRATAWTVQAAATALLYVLNALHAKTTVDYTVAA